MLYKSQFINRDFKYRLQILSVHNMIHVLICSFNNFQFLFIYASDIENHRFYIFNNNFCDFVFNSSFNDIRRKIIGKRKIRRRQKLMREACKTHTCPTPRGCKQGISRCPREINARWCAHASCARVPLLWRHRACCVANTLAPLLPFITHRDYLKRCAKSPCLRFLNEGRTLSGLR